MNIALFGDVHGHLLQVFEQAATFQEVAGKTLDLIVQVGDLGVFPERSRVDRATRRHSERDPSVLGFLQHFVTRTPDVQNLLARTTCPLVFVRGNHEDHVWLDRLEKQSSAPWFAVDAYERVWCLKTGCPLVFQRGDETITLLGIGRIGRPAASHTLKPHYIQPYEQERLARLQPAAIDLLVTHDSPRDLIFPGSGSEEISTLLEQATPRLHCFGHYGGPCRQWLADTGVTVEYKLADVHADQTWEQVLAQGAMGLLDWTSREVHSMKVACNPASFS